MVTQRKEVVPLCGRHYYRDKRRRFDQPVNDLFVISSCTELAGPRARATSSLTPSFFPSKQLAGKRVFYKFSMFLMSLHTRLIFTPMHGACRELFDLLK